jgi:hypothetical protein
MVDLVVFAAARRSRPAGEILSSAGPEERTQRRGPEHDSAAAAGHRVRLLKAEAHRTEGSSNTRSVLRVGTAKNSRLWSAAKRTDQIVFQALCFGDFHLGQQMKVTAGRARPAGCPTGEQNDV